MANKILKSKDMTKIVESVKKESPKKIKFEVGDKAFVLTINPTIKHDEREVAIKNIADFCFLSGQYDPAMFDVAETYICMLAFTNVDPSADMYEIYEFAKATGAYDELHTLPAVADISHWARDAVEHQKRLIESERNAEKVLAPVADALESLANMVKDSDPQKTIEAIEKINSLDAGKLAAQITGKAVKTRKKE